MKGGRPQEVGCGSLQSPAAALMLRVRCRRAACIAPGRLYVQAPPPPLFEARDVAPGPGYVGCRDTSEPWRLCLEAWRGRPPHGAMALRWERDHRGWYQVDGAGASHRWDLLSTSGHCPDLQVIDTHATSNQATRRSNVLAQCAQCLSEEIASRLSKDDLIDMQGTKLAVHSGGFTARSVTPVTRSPSSAAGCAAFASRWFPRSGDRRRRHTIQSGASPER